MKGFVIGVIDDVEVARQGRLAAVGILQPVRELLFAGSGPKSPEELCRSYVEGCALQMVFQEAPKIHTSVCSAVGLKLPINNASP